MALCARGCARRGCEAHGGLQAYRLAPVVELGRVLDR